MTPLQTQYIKGLLQSLFFMESNYYSNDGLREARIIPKYNVLCVEYSEPEPKTTKQYFERVATSSTKNFTYLSDAENYAEDWVLRK